MEDTLNPVVMEIIWAITIIPMVAHNPAWPMIIGKRMYMITPRMVSIEGVNTPPKVPNLFDLAINLNLNHNYNNFRLFSVKRSHRKVT